MSRRGGGASRREHPARVQAKLEMAAARMRYDATDARVTEAVWKVHRLMGEHPLSREDELAQQPWRYTFEDVGPNVPKLAW